MTATLAELVSVVAPHLRPALVAPEALAAVRRVARRSPPVPWAGFETRLAPGATRVDLQQGFRLAAGDAARLADWLQAEPGGDHESPIATFCRWWAGSPALFPYIVLEHDVEGNGESASPGVFLRLTKDRKPGDDLERVEQALELLREAPLRSAARRSLAVCFDACPDGAEVSHIGVMLGRAETRLRVNIRGLPVGGMSSYLDAVGWSPANGGVAALATELIAYADRVILCLDVAGDIGPRVGLEAALDPQPSRRARWAALVRELVRKGLCDAAKGESLLAWPGRSTPVDGGKPWPSSLVTSSLSQPASRFGVLRRYLSHIKFTVDERGALEAKAYLGFRHVWIDRGEADEQARTPAAARTVARSRDIEEAIAAGLSFLESQLNQGGWWRDYDGFSEGGSDEWLTAYIGANLARLPDVAATRLAESAWAALKSRRRSGGWGWNAWLPADADSTAWALRLARLLRVDEDARLRAARDFLQAHRLGPGEYATYQQGHFREFTGRTRELVDGWFRAHTCVSATAVATSSLTPEVAESVRRRQRGDGSWRGYWWRDDELVTALAVDALRGATDVGEDDRHAIARAARWAGSRVGADGAVVSQAHAGPSSFATACSVSILARGEAAGADGGARRRAVEWLLCAQGTDGGWEGSAQMTINPEHPEHPLKTVVDDGGLHTTATVLVALAATRTLGG